MSELMEPLSWLLLERYALGELGADERAHVEARLAASSEDRACLDSIINDSVELPPLPCVKPRRVAPYWLGGLSLAAAIALAVLRPESDVPSRRATKGGEVAVALVSERTGASPRVFREGERFKLMVTCPAGVAPTVVMFQGGQRYQPLAAQPDFACGNQVPWPGAFSLDGREDVEVCVTWGAHDDARSARELEPDVVCERLKSVGAAQ